MRKLNLVALSDDKDGILNALERTNSVEVRLHAETEGTASLPEGGEELRAYLNELEAALNILISQTEAYVKDHDIKESPVPKDGFEVGYSEFRAAGERKTEMDALVEEINRLWDEKNLSGSEQSKLNRAVATAKQYEKAKLPFSRYTDTSHTRTRLGTVAAANWSNLKKVLDELELVAYEAETSEETVLLTVKAHKSAWQETESALSANGFTPCPYSGDQTGAELLSELISEQIDCEKKQRDAEKKLFELASQIKAFKIYCDFVGFELEKAELSGKLRGTERTFLLEAFVPAEQENAVKEALDCVTGASYYEFSDPAEDEEVPTFLKNNAVVRNFETITNMYSTPNAREFDPNTVMSFFYSLFLGFIMADVGYGLMMLFGGGALYFKNKRGGMKSLAGVFAIGGIFAIFWGVLFNSFLGIQLLPFTIMPDAQSQMYNLSGIALPGVLVIALILGIVQLFAGYLCRAAQSWRRKQYLDAILDGGIWAVFSLGVGIAVIGLVEDFHLSSLTTVGVIIVLASLVIAVLTAGRHEKSLGKITKGFGSLYGLISYFTDVLSYIRLYGLMLTGAVIAQVVSQYSILFLTSGSLLIVLGAVLMVIGHVFNLAISLLGAYIHTARLQYVEFFGRFYEGEGALFTPLGSQKKYIYLEQKAA